MSGENIELVRRTFELFNAGQAPLPDFWAEDAEVWPAPSFPEAGPFKGRDELQCFFDGLLEGWKPGTAVVLREFAEAGDKVLVSLEWRAVGEASQVPTSSDWMAVYTIRGDEIVRLEFFDDPDAAISAAKLR